MYVWRDIDVPNLCIEESALFYPISQAQSKHRVVNVIHRQCKHTVVQINWIKRVSKS